MPAVDTVVFDLGGVLIDWDPRLLYRALLDDDEAVEAFLAEVGFEEWNHLQDAGRAWAEAVAEHGARFPHHRHLLAAYPERFAETIVGPIDGTVDVLRDLRVRGGVRLLALTNWSAELFPHARDRFPFLADFEGIVVSGEEGFAKPDPRLWHVLAERHALDPARTAYVDDRQVNVDAAAAEGYDALLFTTPARLRADLAARALL